jgi:UDP-glucose 4-epimerase
MTSVLITGGCGFIGGALARQLADDGHEVRVIDDLSVGTPLSHPKIAEFHASILHRGHLREAMHQTEVVVHAACQAMPVSVEDPAWDQEVNVAGTVNVLEEARREGQRVVHISSCSIYGQQDGLNVPIRENAEPRPFTPYAAGKLGGEAYARAYCAQGWLSTIALRLSNAYGPRQDPERPAGVIAHLLRAKLAGQPLPITGDGSDRRDFTYIDDVVNAIRLSMTSSVTGVFNVGTGLGTTIESIAAMLDCETERHPKRPIDGVSSRALDNTKIYGALGWKPHVPINVGLRRTEAWMRDHLQVLA